MGQVLGPKTPRKNSKTQQNPENPQNPWFLIFYWGFGRPEWFHDVPRPSGTDFALVNAQNGGLTSISDNFGIFGSWISEIPNNSFRKNGPRAASQAKPPCRKWSHTDYLFMRFSKKRVTKSRKPLIFLSDFNVFEKVGSVFFEKPVFHFKPSEASFSGVMCLASRLLENPKWLLENPKWLLENPKGRQIGPPWRSSGTWGVT